MSDQWGASADAQRRRAEAAEAECERMREACAKAAEAEKVTVSGHRETWINRGIDRAVKAIWKAA